MQQTSSFPKALPYFPSSLRSALDQVAADTRLLIQEIRLRTNRPLCIVIGGTEQLLQPNGRLSNTNQNGIMVTAAHMEAAFKNFCEHSVHSFQQEIRRGFITIAGGNRVGLAASAVIHINEINTLRYINSMNVRIASQIYGCAEELYHRTLARCAGGLLICAPPAGGKTTMLRDLCRILAEKSHVSVIDERGEIAALQHGISQFDLGVMCDVFDGYPKVIGIETAVRVMSPQFIICDEIGDLPETEAILHCIHTGVHFIATAHLGSLQELSQRPQLQRLLDAGAFRYVALLGSGTQCGQILNIRQIGQHS